MSGEKPGERRGAIFVSVSLFLAVLASASVYANRQPAAQQPADDSKMQVSAVLAIRQPAFSIQITKDHQRIKLKGQVVSEEAHKTVLGLVKGSFASLDVVDRLKVGDAAYDPNLKVGGISYALKVLSFLENGWASVDERSVSISGVAGNSTLHPTLQATLEERPAGIEVRSTIAPQVYWRGEVASGGHLIMTGYVLTETYKKNLEASAHELLPSSHVANHTNVIADAPEEWTFVTTHSLKILGNLRHGHVHVKDRTISISGAAPTEQAQKEIEALAEKYPRTYALVSKVKVESENASSNQVPLNTASTP